MYNLDGCTSKWTVLDMCGSTRVTFSFSQLVASPNEKQKKTDPTQSFPNHRTQNELNQSIRLVSQQQQQQHHIFNYWKNCINMGRLK